jgi:hypothetical protein
MELVYAFVVCKDCHEPIGIERLNPERRLLYKPPSDEQLKTCSKGHLNRYDQKDVRVDTFTSKLKIG